jgi:hypothetical protein
MVIPMSVQFSRQGMAAVPLAAPLLESSFVRRLLATRDDPTKARVLTWLLSIDDARLLGFGLTPEDIALVRGMVRHRCASEPTDMTKGNVELPLAQEDGR